jgi:uncharacterized integral membrane protein
MIRKIVSFIVLVPIAILGVMFAVANRQTVTVSFDPFDTAQPAYALSVPLFVLVFLVLVAGVILGGCAAWVGQGKWRKVARRLDSDVAQLKQQMHSLRPSEPTPQPVSTALPPPV